MSVLNGKEYERVPLHDLSPKSRIEAVIASCSQFGIHVAQEIEGRPKCDGGARHSIPWVPAPASEVWAICCSPISKPWEDNELEPSNVTVARGLEVILDTLQARDYVLLRHQAATSKVWLVEPSSRYGSPFAADPETIAHRLDVIGPEAWARRRVLPPLQLDDVPRLLTGE